MADLEDARIGQHRPQPLQHRSHFELPRLKLAEIVDMAERHVDRLAALDRERDPDQLGPGHVQGRRLGVDREAAHGRSPRQEGLELRHLGDRRIDRRIAAGVPGLGRTVGGMGVSHLLDPADQCPELVGLEERQERRPVDLAAHGTIERHRQGRVVAERHQRLRQPRLIGEVDQTLPPLRLLDGLGSGQQLVERAVLAQKLGRRLHPDPRHPRHVVRTVAGEGQAVLDQLGPHPEALLDLGRADHLALHRVPHADPVGHELHQVLVRGDDQHLAAQLPCPVDIGRNQVVRLEARHLHRRQAEGPRRVPDQLELRHQLRRRLVAIRLVLVVDLVPEAHPPGIEDDDHVVVTMILHQLEQHRREAEHRIDRGAVAPGHRRQREKGAENVAGAVDQDDARAFALAHGRSLAQRLPTA